MEKDEDEAEDGAADEYEFLKDSICMAAKIFKLARKPVDAGLKRELAELKELIKTQRMVLYNTEMDDGWCQ